MILPIRAFWMMNSNVNRMLAEKDLRALSVAIGGQGGESAKHIKEHLIIEMGVVAKVNNSADANAEAERDQQGFDELRILSALM